MSATSYNDMRNSVGNPGSRDPLEDKMEQIRELLFGEFKRDSDARIALIDARVRELETGLHRKLDAIQARLDTLGSEIKTDRNAAFDDLSISVSDLADRIRRIARD